MKIVKQKLFLLFYLCFVKQKLDKIALNIHSKVSHLITLVKTLSAVKWYIVLPVYELKHYEERGTSSIKNITFMLHYIYWRIEVGKCCVDHCLVSHITVALFA